MNAVIFHLVNRGVLLLQMKKEICGGYNNYEDKLPYRGFTADVGMANKKKKVRIRR